MAFLSNPQQEHDAATDTFQNAVVQGLVNGIVRFRDVAVARPPGGPASTPPPPGAGRGAR
jgi:hypothetical protein